MQTALAAGWATWLFADMLAMTQLPSGATIRPAICKKNSSTECLTALIVNSGGEGGATNVRVGSHAYDRSYAEIESLEYDGLRLQLRWGYSEGQLDWVLTPLENSTANLSKFEVMFTGSYSWMRAGIVGSPSPSSLVFSSYGFPTMRASVLGATNMVASKDPHVLRAELSADGVALSTDPSKKTLQDVVQALEVAARAQASIYEKYSEHAEVRKAVEAAVMWNFIYVPSEAGPFAPVSRGWSFAPGPVTEDWKYVVRSLDACPHVCRCVCVCVTEPASIALF